MRALGRGGGAAVSPALRRAPCTLRGAAANTLEMGKAAETTPRAPKMELAGGSSNAAALILR